MGLLQAFVRLGLPSAPSWAAGSARGTLKGQRSALTKSKLTVDPVKLPKKKKGEKKPFPLLELKDRSRKCFESSCSRSVQSGKIRSRSVSSLHTQFGGKKIRNHVIYPTPLIALEMSDKEGAVVITIFCLSSICVLNLEKYKIIIFSAWGHENIQNDVAQPVQTLEHPKCIFQLK